ncbi:hypothetical protein [Caldimonas thermodepolymerans]|uniref:Uncharacterized protein n=1 Tax=Caldimonas thermodepolymerans TaxID=215580 RepID=A0AA46HVI3_9BURK|nr:hypothetical protein [Caldimonas thermodepolymerans]TCP06586.1 hypothetical protein EV676_10669 [Caldimonas thermodepolymerans]UZG49357.1 hypothetical protein ONS87_06980 [Caldimonas thermodepolymerans]
MAERARPQRVFLAHYTLSNGTRGVLHLVAPASFDAVDRALAIFGEQLRRLSVRPHTH